MSEDYAAVARGLKQQAETTLKANDQTSVIRAAAIAGLAQVSVLLAIHEALGEIAGELRTIGYEVCRDPGFHDHG